VSLADRIYRFLWNRQRAPSAWARHVYKRLARRGLAPDAPFTREFFGLNYQGNLRNNVDFDVYFYGAFEKPLLTFLRDAMRNPGCAPAPGQCVFVDIGANVGQHSLFMAAHGARVYAFEPFAPVREQLQRQLDANRLADVSVYPVGLGNENSRQPFFAPSGNNAGIGSFDPGTAAKGNRCIGELALVRADDYFPEQGIERIDLVKIDVEGFEKMTLAGMRETLRRTRPVIVCELTYGTALSLATLEELRDHLPAGYSLFTFDTRKADGSKARRRDARSRSSGAYRIIPFTGLLQRGQDDVIACPDEKRALLPRANSRMAQSEG
jgi:FkbM family methyltransferase